MMHVQEGLSQLRVTANKEEVLGILHKNLETHSKVVEEAKIGWRKKAEDLLKRRLDDLMSGKLSTLSVSLSPPVDHTEAYEHAIDMLKLHQEDTIVLNGIQVQNLIRDEWDWSRNFWLGNEGYSDTAAVGSAKYK